MDSNPTKNFKIIIRLNQFEELNGGLSNISDKAQRESFVEKFLLEKYGNGQGKLEIVQKPNKAKLIWTPAAVNAEAEAIHGKAIALAKAKNYSEAINKWVQAISLNAHDPDYYFHLGIAFFEIKNFNESIENLNQVIQLCPIYQKAHLILGTAYIKTRKYELAEKHLKESILLHPNHALAHLNLGAVYSILRKYEKGVDSFNKSLELAPLEVRAHFGLGKIYNIQENHELANYHFKKVINIDSNRELTNHAKKSIVLRASPATQEQGKANNAQQKMPPPKDLAEAYQEGYRAYLFTDYEKCIEMYSRYLEQKPDDDFVQYSLGEAYLRNGNALKAADAFQKAIKLNPSKGLYYKALAVAYDSLGKTSEALEFIEKAIELGKSDSVVKTIYGKILLNQEKIEESIAQLESAVSQNYNNLAAKYHLAVAHCKRNEINFAINYFQEITRSPVNSPIKMEAETELQKLKNGQG